MDTIIYALSACKGNEFKSAEKTQSEKRIAALCETMGLEIGRMIRSVGCRYYFTATPSVRELIRLTCVLPENKQPVFVIDNLLLFRDHADPQDFAKLETLGKVVDTLIFEADVELYRDYVSQGGFIDA